MILRSVLLILLCGLSVITVGIAVMVCYEARRYVSDFRNERKERARLLAAAKYDFEVGLDGTPVKLAANHAGLRAMSEAELNRAIDYYEDRDRYLAEVAREAQRRGLVI